jgi:class 3 adenylate cyclase
MMDEASGHVDDALLNLEARSNEELRALLNELYEEEQKISYRRRVLHGKIDILRAELVRRLKEQREAGGDVISGNDVERLITILSNDLRGVSTVDVAEEDEDADS